MNVDTWSIIEDRYARRRSYCAGAIAASEFDRAFIQCHVPADYRDFVLRYGGGLVGTYPIYGLRLAESMGRINGRVTAPDITAMFRELGWPGVENWLVFSVDLSGNPVGFAPNGTVWISDGTSGQIQQLADSFEQFLRIWGLRLT